MRICKKIFPEKLICFAAVLMFCLIPAASHPAAASYTSQTGTSGNLLTNPDWENGVSGWEIAAVSRKDIFEEGELFVSAVYQDIPIEESMAGKILKLSGNICVSPADPQQKVIVLSLELFSDGGEPLFAMQTSEKETSLKYHEIQADITPEAACARVTVEIRKQGSANRFGFSDLCLEVSEKQSAENTQFHKSENGPGTGGFRKSTGSSVQEPRTSSEESGGFKKSAGSEEPGENPGEKPEAEPDEKPEEEPGYDCVFIDYFNIQISIDDVPVRPENKKGQYEEPFLMDDCIYLQYEAAASVLGMSVSYDEKTKTIRLTSRKIPKGTNQYGEGHTETIEADIAYEGIKVILDGKETVLVYGWEERRPFVYDGKICLPMEPLVEKLAEGKEGLKTEWSTWTSTLNIVIPEKDPAVITEPSTEKTTEEDPPEEPETKKEEPPVKKKDPVIPNPPEGNDPPPEDDDEEEESEENGQEEKSDDTTESATESVEEETLPLSEEGKKIRISLEDYMGSWAHLTPEGDGMYLEAAGDCITVYQQEGLQIMVKKYGTCSLDADTGDLLFYEAGYGSDQPQPYFMRLRLKDSNSLEVYFADEEMADEAEDSELFTRIRADSIHDYKGKWQLYTMEWDGIMIELRGTQVLLYSQEDEQLLSAKTGKFYFNPVTGVLQFMENNKAKNSISTFYLKAEMEDQDRIYVFYSDDGSRQGEEECYTRYEGYSLTDYFGKWQYHPKDTEGGDGNIMEISEGSVTFSSPGEEDRTSEKTGWYSCDALTRDLLFYENGHGSLRFRMEDENHLRVFFRDTGKEILYSRVMKDLDAEAFLGTWYKYRDLYNGEYEVEEFIELTPDADKIRMDHSVFYKGEELLALKEKCTYSVNSEKRELWLYPYEISLDGGDEFVSIEELMGESSTKEPAGFGVHLRDEKHLQGIQEDAYTPYTYVRSADDYEPEAVDPEICPPDIHTTMYITLDAGATHDTGIPCEVSFEKGHLKVSLPEASTNKGTRSAITVYGKVEDKYLYDASDDNQSFKARYHGILENEGKLTIGDKSYDVMAGGFGGFSFIETKEKYHDRLPEYILELSLFVHDEEEGINTDISIDLTR